MNLIVFYTVPKLDFVDSQIAKLAHAHIEAVGVNMERKENHFKVFDPVEYQQKQNKWFRHFVSRWRNGKEYKIRKFISHRASLKLIRAYELKRQKYLDNLAENAGRQLENVKPKFVPLTAELKNEIVENVVLNKTKYMDDDKFYNDKVEDDFEISAQNARKIKEAVRRKLKESYDIRWR